MADRLTDMVLGLQRMAENARVRGEDLRYTQQQETYEHLQWLDQLIEMVGKARTVLLEERRRFVPTDNVAKLEPDRQQAKAIGRPSGSP